MGCGGSLAPSGVPVAACCFARSATVAPCASDLRPPAAPRSDLAKNWDINIANELEHYLEELGEALQWRGHLREQGSLPQLHGVQAGGRLPRRP